MRDVVYVAVMVGFFGAAMGLVRVCEWLIGPDEGVGLLEDADAGSVIAEAVAA